MTNSRGWPSKSLVGYVAAYGSIEPVNVSNNMITEALEHNYNVFVYAFGYIDEDNNVAWPSGVSTPSSDLAKQLKSIHAKDGLALISFGGQNNTFCPSDPLLAASNCVHFCQLHGFDGIDLDLEEVDVDSAFLVSFINEFRRLNDDLFITAAPQIAGGYGGPASLAPDTVFSRAFLQAANFDALLIQEYNQFGGAVFDGLQDTEEGFISASFGPLTQLVPSNTKIIIGEPANTAAGSGLSDPTSVVRDIQSGEVLQSPQYGGVMVWAVNYDYEQNWSFSLDVAPVVQSVSALEETSLS